MTDGPGMARIVRPKLSDIGNENKRVLVCALVQFARPFVNTAKGLKMIGSSWSATGTNMTGL